MLEGVTEREEQLLRGERLLEEIERAELRGPHGGLDRAVPAHHDDRHRGPAALQLLEHRHAVVPRHRDVEQHRVRKRSAAHLGERRITVGRLGGAVALVGEDPRERAPDARLVVDDQHAIHRPPCPRQALRRGSSTMKRVPCGRFGWTRT